MLINKGNSDTNIFYATNGYGKLEDEAGDSLRLAQMAGAYERVKRAHNIILDSREPPITAEDYQLAEALRAEGAIAHGNALYLKYGEKVANAVLEYMGDLGIEQKHIDFAGSIFDGVQYESTYTQANSEFFGEPGPMGQVLMRPGNIEHMPLRISIRHVWENAAWNMADSIAAGKLTVHEAAEIQYLITLLHESVHVATTRIYRPREDLYIGRIGLQMHDHRGEELGKMRDRNEALTDIIAGRIFESEAFQQLFPVLQKGKYYPGYEKFFPQVYDSVQRVADKEEISFETVFEVVQLGYFGALEDADKVRMLFFGTSSIFPQGSIIA